MRSGNPTMIALINKIKEFGAIFGLPLPSERLQPSFPRQAENFSGSTLVTQYTLPSSVSRFRSPRSGPAFGAHNAAVLAQPNPGQAEIFHGNLLIPEVDLDEETVDPFSQAVSSDEAARMADSNHLGEFGAHNAIVLVHPNPGQAENFHGSLLAIQYVNANGE